MQGQSSTTIARLQALLREQLGLELSGAELAELLWLRLQRGDIEEVMIEAVEPQNELPIGASDIQFSDQVLEVENVVLPQTATLAASSPSEQEMRPKDILPLQVPEAMALRNQRAIGRSLRPLLRKVPSVSRRVMLEEETAIAIAERQIWDPVMRAESERWLDLVIVIEETRSYGVWRETLAEFRQLLERHGAFRSVKTWHLRPNDFGELQLFSSSTSSSGRSVRSVLSADGRRLVMLMSDCTARSWQSGEMLKVLELWSRENPVTIVQLLPPSYWERTALRSGHSVGLRSQVAGALSRDWQVTGLSAVRRSWLPMDGLKFPVVTIEAEALGEWAKAVAAGVSVTSGFMLDRWVSIDRETEPSINSTPKSPEELVRQFRATASGEAQSLAAVLAMFPVVNGVIRLIQKTVLETETIALYLAEMVLSGLLVRVDRSGQDYDFVTGVRSAIRARVERDVAIEVAEDVAEAVIDHLPEEVRDRVSADIARRFGHSIGWFEAFLYTDLDWGDEAIAVQMMPFADVTAETLRDWGGQYAEMVDRSRRTTTLNSDYRNSFDRSIKRMLSNKDESEFKPLHQTIERCLRQYRLQGSFSADEIINEAYVRAAKKLERGEKIPNAEAWIRTTCFYIVVEWSRQSQRTDSPMAFYPNSDQDFEECEVALYNPNSMTNLDLLAMREFYEKLSDLDREILYLNVSGLSWDEIADHLIKSGKKSGDKKQIAQNVAQRASRTRESLHKNYFRDSK